MISSQAVSRTTVGQPSRDPEIAVEMREVTKFYGSVRAVDGVDLLVRRGEFLTLLGPSGSGKTTLLRLIAGFVELSSGNIYLRGRDISNLTPAQRGIGMVFQHYMLFPHMTVGQNIAYGLKMHRKSSFECERRVSEMLSLVRMEGYEDRLPKQLSGGQQQRVALARALAFGPELLLMDEPLGALDRALRIDMQLEIRRIHRELKTTIIYVTHDQREALAMSDRIAIMRGGHILALDTPYELYEKPSSLFVATFFSGSNLVPVEVVANEAGGMATIRYAEQQIAALSPSGDLEGRAVLALRPETFGLRADQESLRFNIRVDELVYLGDIIQIIGIADKETPVVARLDPTGVRNVEIEIGKDITFYVRQSDLVVLPQDFEKDRA